MIEVSCLDTRLVMRFVSSRRDPRPPLRFTWILSSSVMLYSIGWFPPTLYNIPEDDRIHCLVSVVSRLAPEHYQSSVQWLTGSSLLGCEADHLPAYRAGGKKEWSYTSTPYSFMACTICVHFLNLQWPFHSLGLNHGRVTVKPGVQS